MICDMIAASKIYKGKEFTLHTPLEYFERQNYGRFVHPGIQAFMEEVFTTYAQKGDSFITKANLTMLYKKHTN